MEYQDYYETLGVPRRRLRRTSRRPSASSPASTIPDKKPGDKTAERRFKAVNEANAVLSDPDKRKKYDRLGKDWEAYSRAGVDPDAANPSAGGSPFGFATGGARAPASAATSATSSGRPATPASSRTSSGSSSAATPAGGRRRWDRAPAAVVGRPAGPSFEDILTEMGLNQPGATGAAPLGSAAPGHDRHGPGAARPPRPSRRSASRRPSTARPDGSSSTGGAST